MSSRKVKLTHAKPKKLEIKMMLEIFPDKSTNCKKTIILTRSFIMFVENIQSLFTKQKKRSSNENLETKSYIEM